MGARVEHLLATPWTVTLAVALLIALPILVLGELSATEGRESVRAARLAEVSGLAERGAGLVGDHVGSVRDQLTAELYSSALHAQAAACFFLDGYRGPCADGFGRVLRDLKALMPASTGEVALVAPADLPRIFEAGHVGGRGTADFASGDVLATSGPLLGARNVAATDYFAVVSRSGRPIVSIAQRGTATDGGSPSMIVAVPAGTGCRPSVFSGGPCFDIHYILTAEVPLDAGRAWLAPLLAVAEDAYIVDQSGRLLARAAAPAGAEALRDLSGDPTVSAALAGARVAREGDDPRGSGRRLLASAPVPELGWHVVVVRSAAPLAAELGALDQARAFRFGLVVFLLVGAYVVASGTSRAVRQRRALGESLERQTVIAMENVRLVSELRSTNTQLEAATEAKSKFLASMSHELRTPMNAILGFTDALLAGVDGELNDEQRESLGYVQKGGRDLLGLVNDVLDLAKIEAGRIALSLERFSPLELVELVLAQLRPVAEADRTTVVWHDQGAPAEIAADRGRLRQILTNLVGNALKFAKGGEVSVTVSADNGTAHFAVRDTGRGVPADQRAAIFEEFRQARADDPGTGLGLPISRRLARLMGGDITLESEEGTGSTFTVTLPLEAKVTVSA